MSDIPLASETEAAPRSALLTQMWFVYVIRCRDNSLYTGVATDVSRRFAEHQGQGPRSARYLRGRGPLVLVYQQEAGDRSAALKLEYRIKQLPRQDKLRLVQGQLRLTEVAIDQCVKGSGRVRASGQAPGVVCE